MLPECAVVFVVLKLTHMCYLSVSVVLSVSGLCCVKTHSHVLPECAVVFVVLKLTHMCYLSVQWS